MSSSLLAFIYSRATKLTYRSVAPVIDASTSPASLLVRLPDVAPVPPGTVCRCGHTISGRSSISPSLRVRVCKPCGSYEAMHGVPKHPTSSRGWCHPATTAATASRGTRGSRTTATTKVTGPGSSPAGLRSAGSADSMSASMACSAICVSSTSITGRRVGPSSQRHPSCFTLLLPLLMLLVRACLTHGLAFPRHRGLYWAGVWVPVWLLRRHRPSSRRLVRVSQSSPSANSG